MKQTRISNELIKKLESLSAEWKATQDKHDLLLERVEAAEFRAAAIADGKISDDKDPEFQLKKFDYPYVVSGGGKGFLPLGSDCRYS